MNTRHATSPTQAPTALALAATLASLLPGCGVMSHTVGRPIVAQYENTRVRVISKQAYTVAQYNHDALASAREGGRAFLPVDKPGDLKVHLVSTYISLFKNGPVLAPVRFVAIEPDAARAASPGDILEVRTGASILDEPGKTAAEIVRIVCRRESPDWNACYDDPRRGGSLGIVDPETGRAHNVF